MRYGIITLTWVSPFTTANFDLLNRVAALGYDQVEIFLEDERHIDYGAARDRLAELELAVSICVNVNARRDVSSADSSVREAGVAYLKHCIGAVVAMGGTLVGGPLYGDQIFYGGSPAVIRNIDEARALRSRAVTSLKEVGEYAAERGVMLGVEPLNRFETSLACTARQVSELVDEIDCSAVGVTLDSYHMSIEENNTRQAIIDTGSRLVHFQANENHRGPLGAGQCDWEGMRSALSEIGYQGALVAEPFRREPEELGMTLALWTPPEDQGAEDLRAGESLKFLKSTFADS